jgi:uncharacterized SAM-dependent methyltransferase
MPELETRDLRKIELAGEQDLEAGLRESIMRRELPDCYLYLGDGGTRRWLELCESDEFPICSHLSDLLEDSVGDLCEHFMGPLDLMSVGVGSGAKERILLEGLMSSCDLNYIAVDVSGDMVDRALEASADIPVPALGIVARFEDLRSLEAYCENPVLLCMLGNSFCNFDPDYALSLVRTHLGPGDNFLFDCSLKPNDTRDDAAAAFAEQVESVYRSQVNMRFNIWPLVERGMRPDACRFHLDLVRAPSSAGEVHRTSKRLEILEDSTVTIGGEDVKLQAGETVRMGFTYKYSVAQVRSLLKMNNFEEVALFATPDGENLLALVK